MVLLLHRCPQVQASASLRVEVFPSVLLVLLLVLVVLALALLVVSPRKVAFLQAELRRAFLAVAVLLQVLLVSLLQVSLRAVRLRASSRRLASTPDKAVASLLDMVADNQHA